MGGDHHRRRKARHEPGVAAQAGSHPDFFHVVLWGQMADFATRYLTKGRLVYVAGRLSSRQWQATDGTTRRTVEIVANRLQALSRKSAPATREA